MGSGIEQEVIHNLFVDFQNHRDKWFSPRSDSFYALSTTTHALSSQFVSESRQHNLAILGTVTALWLLRGLPNFLIHDCNLHSIHPAILSE